MRQQANKLLTQYGCGRDVDFAADRHDDVTIVTADGKRRAGKDMIDLVRRHLRPPILVPGRTGLSCAQGDTHMTAGARGARDLAHNTLRRPSCRRRLTPG